MRRFACGNQFSLSPVSESETQEKLTEFFGRNRYVWNKALEHFKETKRFDGSSNGRFAFVRYLERRKEKPEYAFLFAGDQSAFPTTLSHLFGAFVRFHGHLGEEPVFQSKINTQRYKTPPSHTIIRLLDENVFRFQRSGL